MNWLTLMELPFHNSLLTCFHRAPRFLFAKCDFFTPIVLITDFENLDVTTGDTSVAEDAHSSGTPDPTPGFIWSLCRPYFSSICCLVIFLVTLVLPC